MFEKIMIFAVGVVFGFLVLSLVDMAKRSDDEWIDDLDPEEDEDEID